MADVNLYPEDLDWLLNSPDGPVGVVIEELSEKAAAIATAAAPVIRGGTSYPGSNFSKWGKMFDPRYQYGSAPGTTRASVRPSGFRYNALGQLYSGVNVNYGSTLFLQQGGGRYGRAIRHPFMSVALETVEL
jgi:hypothetical protein